MVLVFKMMMIMLVLLLLMMIMSMGLFCGALPVLLKIFLVALLQCQSKTL